MTTHDNADATHDNGAYVKAYRLLVNRMLVAWDTVIYDQRDIPRRESAMAAALEVALAWERARIEEEIRLSWGSPEQMFADREILRIVRDRDDDAR